MLGNFSYYNPTKLYFGDESLNFLKDELKGYGPVVLLNYGSGSVKRNGIYDQVVAILREAGKAIVENPGVMTNPTLEKLNEGVKIMNAGELFTPAPTRLIFCDPLSRHFNTHPLHKPFSLPLARTPAAHEDNAADVLVEGEADPHVAAVSGTC